MIIGALLFAATAHADESVAVLPWTSSSSDLAVYGEPVARELVSRLGKTPGLSIRAIGKSDRVPDDVSLVIDGRIVGKNGKVRLEARIRDPELGRAMATERTRMVPLAKLDVLAVELSKALSASLEKAIRSKKSAAKAIEISQPKRAVGPAVKTEMRQRRMIVVRVAGRVAGGVVPVTAPATQAAVQLARRLGYVPVPVEERGLLTVEQARALLAQHDADFALVLYVDSVEFRWRRVLTARGRVRVALLNRSGATNFDRSFVTDTLVGSRGDGHAALVYFVVEQIGYAAQPLLAKRVR